MKNHCDVHERNDVTCKECNVLFEVKCREQLKESRIRNLIK